MSKALHIHSKDNTAVCTSEVKAGEEVEVIDSDGSRSFINAVSSIPFLQQDRVNRYPRRRRNF